MRFECTSPVLTMLEDRFYCRSRRCVMTLEECIDRYVDADAFLARRSTCFRCPQGRRQRQAFADGESSPATMRR